MADVRRCDIVERMDIREFQTGGVDLAERPTRPFAETVSALSWDLSWDPWDSIELADGERLTVRQLRGDDVERLRRLHGRLSPASLRRRFMTACPRPSDAMLARLVDLDHRDREALVAVAGDEIMAVARYHRRPGTAEAEVAITVADAWQRRGIARALVRRLVERARENGIDAFVGIISGENDPARGLLRTLAPGAERRFEGGEVTFRTSLTA